MGSEAWTEVQGDRSRDFCGAIQMGYSEWFEVQDFSEREEGETSGEEIMQIPKVDIPEGQCRDWRVEKFEVTEEDAKRFNLRQSIQALQGRSTGFIQSGNYTRLMHHSSVIMSDTPWEVGDLKPFLWEVHGQVLINGLGLGVALNAVLLKLGVGHVTVIEIAPEVIELVGLHYEKRFGSDKLSIIEADAFLWKPPKGQRYDVCWHDVWDAVCTDNLSEMTKLKRRYGRRCGWQRCWAEWEHYRLKSIGW